MLLLLLLSLVATDEPPNPQFPGAFTVAWNLTEGTGAGSMALESSGSTELDDAGSGRQRVRTLLQRSSHLHPGLTYHYVIDAISDWAAGGSYTRTCTNQTGAELCGCVHAPLSGRIPYSRSPAASYAGTATVGGVPCYRWQLNAAIVWTATAGPAPNLLVDALLADSSGLAEQAFGTYALGAPDPSRWVVPAEWVRVLACWLPPPPLPPSLRPACPLL